MALYFADECIDIEIVREMRSRGSDVVYAKETCPGAPDPAVLRLATEGGRILIADDASANWPCARASPQLEFSYFRFISWPPPNARAARRHGF